MNRKITKQFLKEFYENDARKQEEREFVKYSPNLRRMYENLSHFERYYVLERQKEILNEVTRGSVVGKTILDCGCGEGFISLELSLAGANVLGIDLSANKVRMAKRLESSSRVRNVNFVVADAESLPLKQKTCDIVVLSETIEHLPNPKFCLNEIALILTAEGTAYITVPKSHERFSSFFGKEKNSKIKGSPDLTPICKFDPHIQSFSRDEFFNLLQSCGFATVNMRGIVFPMPNRFSPVLRLPVIAKVVNLFLKPLIHISTLFSCRKLAKPKID